MQPMTIFNDIRTARNCMSLLAALVCPIALLPGVAHADVQVSSLFGDNMVLQRGMAVAVWGMAAPGEAVTVKIGEAKAETKADTCGKWTAKLPAMKTNATAQQLIITGKNTLTIQNVLVGDVWVCAGQSNMEMALGSCNAP